MLQTNTTGITNPISAHQEDLPARDGGGAWVRAVPVNLEDWLAEAEADFRLFEWAEVIVDSDPAGLVHRIGADPLLGTAAETGLAAMAARYTAIAEVLQAAERRLRLARARCALPDTAESKAGQQKKFTPND